MTSFHVRRWSILVLAVPALLLVPASAQAAAPHHFKNCTDVHTRYAGGIAKVGAKDHRSQGGKAKRTPYVNTALYNVNKSMDRDHDGIACESS
jgi:Excalibur calcium-binding domain